MKSYEIGWVFIFLVEFFWLSWWIKILWNIFAGWKFRRELFEFKADFIENIFYLKSDEILWSHQHRKNLSHRHLHRHLNPAQSSSCIDENSSFQQTIMTHILLSHEKLLQDENALKTSFSPRSFSTPTNLSKTECHQF